ncbi:uncharacterized protein F4822DRAFT_444581 [Hypoxylon trugodes]|uniref:uncharacterized protein n=1 Tax=Hypoxylon trugodes TaxID=326681 RepID=UPI002195FB6B|nr:uncharacterized protein F4822DRAFT_444581 [Hypoxylon trugodes]KAI1382491.1 hypothetical protein F4822DRAFT_444581 [Hypoxylon trugodes]
MAPIRQSNRERRLAREQCREKLSRHIAQTLGITVEPAEVCLVPRTRDPYAWNILPEKNEVLAKIFAKNLSEHSISAYRMICEEVGNSFEAVGKTMSSSLTAIDIITMVSQHVSFGTIIGQLKEENVNLSTELSKWINKTEEESAQRQLTANEVDRLLRRQQEYEDEARRRTDVTTRLFQGSLMKSMAQLDQIIPTLIDLKRDISITSTEISSELNGHIIY